MKSKLLILFPLINILAYPALFADDEDTLKDYTHEIALEAQDPIFGAGISSSITEALLTLTKTGKKSIVIVNSGILQDKVVGDLTKKLIGNESGLYGFKKVRILDFDKIQKSAKGQKEAINSRLNGVLKSLHEKEPNTLLVVPEIASVLNTGALRPFLTEGLRIVGFATEEEITVLKADKEHDHTKTLKELFDPQVEVPLFGIKETDEVLTRMKAELEKRMDVPFSPPALLKASQIANQNMAQGDVIRNAIIVLEKAAEIYKQKLHGIAIITQKQAELERVRAEIAALEEETDERSLTRAVALTKTKTELEEQIEVLNSTCETCRTAMPKARDLESKLREKVKEKLRFAESGVRNESLEADIRGLSEQIAGQKSILAKADLDTKVGRNDVAQAGARLTGISYETLKTEEKQRLRNLEDFLNRRVKGQPHAKKALADAIRRARAGLQDPKKPVVLAFLGPTGTGKTELAKAIAEFLFGDEDAMLRLDMTEYVGEHSKSRLIGAPPGYKQAEEGGQLTNAVRKRPQLFVLVDEAEKGKDVLNIFQAILDDGRATDGLGRTVKFNRAIFAFTSNTGVEEGAKETDPTRRTAAFLRAWRAAFPADFVNRIPEVIVFDSLGVEVVSQIVVKFEELRNRWLYENNPENPIKIELSAEARELITKHGTDETFGARYLERAFIRLINTPIANLIVEDKIKDGETVFVHVIDGELVFYNKGHVKQTEGNDTFTFTAEPLHRFSPGQTESEKLKAGTVDAEASAASELFRMEPSMNVFLGAALRRSALPGTGPLSIAKVVDCAKAIERELAKDLESGVADPATLGIPMPADAPHVEAPSPLILPSGVRR